MSHAILDAEVSLKSLKRNESFIYHTGNLAFDRQHSIIADHIGSLAMDLSLNGKVYLVQEKIYPSCYNYIAIGAQR